MPHRPPYIMSETALEKPALRRMLLANRQAIEPEVRARWDAAIGARLIDWWIANMGLDARRALGVYWPIRSEPDLHASYAQLASMGVKLALPMVVAKDAPLRFLAWTPGDALIKDLYGVAIPANQREVRPDALLAPCVGFNCDRVRLGYGGGFYDRTLALAPRPLAAGIGYACGLATFDAAPHDIALDAIITEASVIEGGLRR
jgi:5-formyltetrahydrofolate cyclo-ligase